MTTPEIVEATQQDAPIVAALVNRLLLELEPSAQAEIAAMPLAQTAEQLLTAGKIWAFLAKQEGVAIGVITLHECAAIYTGGLFGEISELYVQPQHRSENIGALLLNAAIEKAQSLHWKRLEVGSPPPAEHTRVLRFYEQQGFLCTGARLRRLIAP